jgi:chitinase
MEFIPDQVTPEPFTAQIKALQEQGKKVLISLGGAGPVISLDDTTERDTFVVSVMNILDTYGFDGIDIDFEGASLTLTGGTIAAPVDPPVIHLIGAIREIMKRYHEKFHRRMILTLAPETAFVQGGQTSYGGFWGSYLPVIDALRDSITFLHIQLYNSGTMYGLDGQVYEQGTPDFIVAMTEAVIRGFNTSGGWFAGLPAEKIVVGLPACELQVNAGYVDTANVRAAIDYLRGRGPQPGSYTLAHSEGYPNLRGMMTWSINWDATPTCGSAYDFADNYERLFGNVSAATTVHLPCGTITLYPNPAHDLLHIRLTRTTPGPLYAELFNTLGERVLSQPLTSPEETLNISALPAGVYYLRIGTFRRMVIKY